MKMNFTYADCVKQSEQICWKLDDVMAKDAKLDFTRPFLPSALAPTDLDFLGPKERKQLNQIAGNSYLNLFHFVEEYILATMMQHAQAEMFGDLHQLRALHRFVDEELKHQQLFERYRDAFARDFGTTPGVIDNAAEVAAIIMGHSQLAVLLITLHIEWMTQRHYVECVKGDDDVDDLFKNLLHKHWLEESQHARIDMLKICDVVSELDAASMTKAIDEYLEILTAFDALLTSQADLDVTSLETALGRTFDDAQKDALSRNQVAGYQKTFLWYGMTHPRVTEVLVDLDASKAKDVTTRAEQYA